MATLSFEAARFPSASTARDRRFRSEFRQPSTVEVRVLLITLAALLLMFASVGSHRSLDERAMLSAMLAAGGMPLVYSPPAQCRVSNHRGRFDHHDIRTLLRN